MVEDECQGGKSDIRCLAGWDALPSPNKFNNFLTHSPSTHYVHFIHIVLEKFLLYFHNSRKVFLPIFSLLPSQ